MGRYIVPREYVRYIRELQTRDKQSDPKKVQQISNDYERYGILLEQPVPICAFNHDEPHILEGIAGYNRDMVFVGMSQDIYLYDIYDFDVTPCCEYNKEVVRNTSNHHKGNFSNQTKPDYIKSVSSAIDRGLIPLDETAIEEYVNKISDKSSDVNRTIVKEVCAGEGVYPNFQTYSSSRKKGVKNSLQTTAEKLGLPPSGKENRKPEQIVQQGCITYTAADGDSQSSWMRGITNSSIYGVPSYLFGYSDKRVDDLSLFRRTWMEDFIKQKQIMIGFASSISKDDQIEIDENNFPVKFGGFYPQYIKPNPEHKGAATEFGLVDWNGEPIEWTEFNQCLSIRFEQERDN